MAEYVRQAGAGVRTAQIDEGLRAHMNKVYGTMSVGMLITALAAWAVAGLAVTTEPTAYQVSADQYLTSFGAATTLTNLEVTAVVDDFRLDNTDLLTQLR